MKEVANKLFAKGKFLKCCEAYEELIRLDPSDPHLRVRYAEVQRRLGRREIAVLSYRTAARIFLETGHLARAHAALNLALQLAPGNAILIRALKEIERYRMAENMATAPKVTDPNVTRVGPLPLEEPKPINLADFGFTPLEAMVQPQQPPPLPAKVRAEIPEDAKTVATVLPSTQTFLVEVRRLSTHMVAIRPSRDARWVVLSSAEPIQAHFAETLEAARAKSKESQNAKPDFDLIYAERQFS